MSTQWKKVTVGEIAEVKGGKRLPKGKLVQDEPTPFPYLRVTDFGDNGLDTSAIKYIDEDAQSKVSRYTITNRDIYISIAGTIGRVGIVPAKFSGANLTENAAKICEIHPHVDERFLMYFLRTENGQGQIAGLTVGTSQPKLALFRIKEIEISLPDLPTQRKIAGILSAYDDLIENNLRRIKILEQMAQSLYREWFVHFRFPGHESAKFVDSALGQIPTGWEVKAISDFAKVVTGKTPSKANEDFFGEDIPFLKTPDMHGQMFILRTNEYLSTAGAQSQANKTLPVGSICVSCIGTIGVISITTEPCQTNQQINSVVLADEASREFLFFWLREAKQMLENLGSNGATMGNVNKSKFEGMKLVCPIDDLLARFHSLAEPMFEQIERLFRKIQNLRQTRDLLLPKLLSGEK